MTARKNPKPEGLPLTLTAAQVLHNMGVAKTMDNKRPLRHRVDTTALSPATTSPFARTPPAQPAPDAKDAAGPPRTPLYAVEELQPSPLDLTKDVPGWMKLEVTQIQCYDHNPRQFTNEKEDDIRASIAAQGFHDALVVTRRGVGQPYMLAAGSNTTLKILQELWATTQDERFHWVNCVFQPFEDESRLLAQHLGENLNRGDMRFWEVATAMLSLLAMIQRDRVLADPSAKPMSIREQAAALTERGLRADRSSISRWQFAADRLAPLGPATSQLTRLMVDQIQPRLNALAALAARFGISESAYWTDLVHTVLRTLISSGEFGGELEAEAIGLAVEAELAIRCNEPAHSIRQMLSLLKLSPELSLAELRAPSPNIIAGPAQTGGTPPERGALGDTTARGPGAASPSSIGKQPPLPLGPGLVRSDGSSPAGATRSGAPRSGANPAPAAERQTPATDGQPGLFTPSATEGEPLQVLHDAVAQLLATAGIADTMRIWPAMPLGFYLELPDPQAHPRRKVDLAGPEHKARIVKSTVWWTLVLMSGQFREGCVPHMDTQSRFFREFATDSNGNPLEQTDVDNDPAELHDLVRHRLSPSAPMRAAMQQLRIVEEAAARLLEQSPERWKLMAAIHESFI